MRCSITKHGRLKGEGLARRRGKGTGIPAEERHVCHRKRHRGTHAARDAPPFPALLHTPLKVFLRKPSPQRFEWVSRHRSGAEWPRGPETFRAPRRFRGRVEGQLPALRAELQTPPSELLPLQTRFPGRNRAWREGGAAGPKGGRHRNKNPPSGELKRGPAGNRARRPCCPPGPSLPPNSSLAPGSID